jgi:hypothetical protein
MADEPIPGASRVSMARVPLCVRGMAARLSGWRLEFTSAQGGGAVVLVETGAVIYRGFGVCLGWGQQDLERLYRSLLPNEPSDPEPLQLG